MTLAHVGKTVIWKHGSVGQPGAMVGAGLKGKRHRRPEGVRAAGHSLPSVFCSLVPAFWEDVRGMLSPRTRCPLTPAFLVKGREQEMTTRIRADGLTSKDFSSQEFLVPKAEERVS